MSGAPRIGAPRSFNRWVPLILAILTGCSATALEGPEAGTRAVNGTQLFVSEVGEGPPLLVIHGGPGMEHSYLPAGLRQLESTSRVTYYDQRGTGRSAEISDPDSLSLDAFLGDIDGVRALLGVDRIDVLAHSWGGLLAMLYAARFPEHVRSLILVASVEPGQRFQAIAGERQNEARTADDAALIDSLVASPGFAERDPGTMNQLYWAALRPTFADRASAELLTIEFTELTARRGGDVAAALMTPLGAFDFWSELGAITAPTLLIHGAADPTPVEAAEAIAAEIGDAELVVIEGAGHFPFLEQPDEFGQAVTGFLDAHRTEGRP